MNTFGSHPVADHARVPDQMRPHSLAAEFCWAAPAPKIQGGIRKIGESVLSRLQAEEGD
jgi:hypothetical protein